MKKSPNVLDRAQDYDDLIWAETFKSHGIGEKFFKTWFFNYEVTTDGQKANLDHMIAYCRRNTSLALIGDVGNGKTHLAIAVLKDAIICAVNKPRGKSYEKQVSPGHYYTLSDLNRRYRESVTNREISEVDFMENICTMKCLIIDEIHIKSDTDSEGRMFQEIVDKRYANNLQTIYVGNVSFNRFSKILGKRLMDRLQENGLKIMRFNGKSYRTKNNEEL